MAVIKDDKVINDAFEAYLKKQNVVLPINYGQLNEDNLDDCKRSGYGYAYAAGLYGPFQVIEAIGFVIQIKFENNALKAKIRCYRNDHKEWSIWRPINILAE